MKLFDARHKWGPRQHEFPAQVVRTCEVCGRTDRMEMLVPDAFVELVAKQAIEFLGRPNPLLAKWRDDKATFFTVETE